MSRTACWLLCSAILLSACGGGSGGGGSSSSSSSSSASSTSSTSSGSSSSAATYTIGGTISGLNGSLVLQNNGGNNLSTTGNGAFTFSTALTSGAGYSVTVFNQPAGQSCPVINSTGTVATTNITNVQVNCTTPVFAVQSATLATARVDHAATRLADGTVLITGGFGVGSIPAAALNTAELYNPATGTFVTLANQMQQARTNHSATLLPNGKVLIAGGQYNNDDDGHNTAELYDPSTQAFTALTATLVSPRGGHTATLLPNGKVLIAGGFYGPSNVLSDAELYDPATQTFTALSAKMVTLRGEHSATLLPNGQVLIAGGTNQSTDVEVNTAELYDPVTQTFTALSTTMASIRAGHAAAALSNGQILLVGGASLFDENNLGATAVLDSAEIFNPITQTFTTINTTLSVPRLLSTATTLVNGAVLIVGGARIVSGPAIQVFNTTEMYGP